MAVDECAEFARRVRIETLRMVHRAQASHIGSAFSMADILAVLYGPDGKLEVRPAEPDWSGRDRFILSKGHACAGLYATLALRGFLPLEALETYGLDGSDLMSHASHKVPGVELSTGSLGHGLSVGCGLAYGARLQSQSWRVVALLSDGELDEGSTWEAILFAAQHNLDRLWCIVDVNRLQGLGGTEEILRLEPIAAKFEAFGWSVREVEGHDLGALRGALDLDRPPELGKPTAVVARTTKGRGVSFMENELLWHYKPPNGELFEAAVAELGDG